MSIPDAVPRSRPSELRDDIAIGGVLVAIWTLLWGELSIANVVSGATVAALLLLVFPIDHHVIAVRHRLHPVAAVRLLAFFVYDLIRSTLLSAADVIRPRSRVRTGIVACPLRVDNDGLVTFLTNMIAISPGTMPIDVSYNPHVIYVHVLRNDDPDATRRLVSLLEELAVAVLGGPEALAAVTRPAPWPPPPPEEPPEVTADSVG
ncbi:MAG: Na+/H+ antiporter subunit E [Acidimicrobiales bacterium]